MNASSMQTSLPNACCGRAKSRLAEQLGKITVDSRSPISCPTGNIIQNRWATGEGRIDGPYAVKSKIDELKTDPR
jgi:hypothetical protein